MSVNDPSEAEPELRRLIPRQFVGWKGRYLVDGAVVQTWRDCRFLDISSAGAGLELMESTAAEVESKRIVVSLELIGDIRHAEEKGNRRIGVGIEFVELTEAEKAYIASLKRLNARW